MRNLKKFLALALAMMMACSLVVTGSAAKWNSGAGNFDDQNGVTPAFEEGVAVVTGMKIFKGDAGTKDFRPAANIKRSEVAAIVYRLVTGDVDDSSAYLYTHVAPFTDVNPDDWFAGYVGFLWNAEIIKGSNTERTQFNPYGEVTGYEALAMVLRAMGYDENDEFTGAGWQIRVGQYANKTGLLVNVNTTNYGAGHLNAAARRDTVAEIIFQAAQADLVIYTPAFGYETTNVQAGNTTNRPDTLGYANFGLVWDRGIVVGNQATGESATKMGVARYVSGGLVYRDRNITNDSYNYSGIAVNDATNNRTNSDHGDYAAGTANVGSVTLSFDHETPLAQFGHANKVWYRDGSAGTLHTYAWFDEATKTAIVHTETPKGTPDEVTNANDGLYVAAENAGFTVATTTGTDDVIAFGSDKYDRMGPLNAAAAAASNDSRVEVKDDVASDQIHMYALISNSRNNKLDVVIALDAEVARIYDTNDTATSKRIVLEEATLGGDTTRNESGKGEILDSHMTSGSVKSLGTAVEAWVVDGTILNSSNIAPNRDIDSFYETIAVKAGPSGMVSTIDGEGTVTLADGTQIKKSYLYDVVMSGVVQEGITAGKNLSFVVDQWGRYLGLSSDPGFRFIYGTFADHSYGNVGSGDLKYLIYGVDTNGGKIIDQPLTEMAKGRQGGEPTFEALTGEVFNKIEVARRDYGTTLTGNQVAEGVYRGGVVTTDGTWWVNDETDPVNYNYRTLDKAGGGWSFTSGDAANGFKDVTVGDVGRVLLTSNTVFYVVSGTGTASLNVKTYNGMAAFLEGASSVSIDPDYKNNDVDDDSYDVVYMTTADTYNSIGDRTTQNAMVTKVFVYEKAVTRVNNAALYYAHSDKATDLKIAGAEDDYSQYELWQGGTKGTYFIDNSDTIAVDTFYRLTKVARQVNGVDVYRAVAVGAPALGRHDTLGGGICWTDQKFDYFATNNTSTARIGNTGDEAVYRVDEATVVDLTTSAARHHDGGCSHAAHNEIKTVKDLFNAISVGYNVQVSILNNGVNTTLIYVVDITK